MINFLIYSGLVLLLVAVVLAMIAAARGIKVAGKKSFLPLRFIPSEKELYQKTTAKIRPFLRIAMIVGLIGVVALIAGLILGV